MVFASRVEPKEIVILSDDDSVFTVSPHKMIRIRSTQHVSFLHSKDVNATLSSPKYNRFGYVLISVKPDLLAHRGFSFSFEGVSCRNMATKALCSVISRSISSL